MFDFHAVLVIFSKVCRSLPKTNREQLHSAYNAHMLHSTTADPFKLALYKIMGKIDPARRSVAQVTVTTEDWLWFQLSMVSSASTYPNLQT